jgi:uncharacterized protein YcbK (DUF882 family)
MPRRTGLAILALALVAPLAVCMVVLAPVRPAQADIAGPPPPPETGGAADPRGVAGGDEAERPDEGGAGESESPAPTRKTKSRKRRGVSGHLVTEDKLRKRLPPPPSGNLYLYRPVERESLKLNIFNPDGSYNVDAIRAASHMLRCRRTDTQKEMEPRLLAVLSHVFDHFGEQRIDVVSGFRNQRKTTSYHYKGTAADIRIEGVPARKLKAFVETLDAGGMGIGIYPITGFVHIDVRPPPSYRWVDYARSNPDAVQKKPPRWFKKKRLQS